MYEPKKHETIFAATKKKLIKAADQVSTLEEQRGAISKKIDELDAQRDKLSRSLQENRGRIADAAASILFVAWVCHPFRPVQWSKHGIRYIHVFSSLSLLYKLKQRYCAHTRLVELVAASTVPLF